MSSVFISYSRSDAAIVDRIAKDLQAEGIDTWFDRQDIAPGENWEVQIRTAIGEAKAVLVIISRASLSSRWVQEEIRTGSENQKRSGGSRLIPVLLEKVELPEFLAGIQYADFTDSYYVGMKDLIRALKASSGPKPRDILPVAALAKEVAGEVAKLLGLEKTHATMLPDAIDPKLVFVIMAFRDDMEPIYEGISAAATTVGLNAKRVKDIPGDYRITDQVLKMIRSAHLIVVDLSHERPNVYFELGYARGLGKIVITIAREASTIHFDVKDWTYITYIDSRSLERDLKKRFEHELSRMSPGAQT